MSKHAASERAHGHIIGGGSLISTEGQHARQEGFTGSNGKSQTEIVAFYFGDKQGETKRLKQMGPHSLWLWGYKRKHSVKIDRHREKRNPLIFIFLFPRLTCGGVNPSHTKCISENITVYSDD